MTTMQYTKAETVRAVTYLILAIANAAGVILPESDVATAVLGIITGGGLIMAAWNVPGGPKPRRAAE